MVEKIEIGYAIKEYFLGNQETREELIEIKKSIIKDFIDSLKKNKEGIDDSTGECIEKYLINDGSIEDVFQDIFRGCELSIDIPEYMDNIKEVKKIISSIQEKPTSEKLSTLKAEIMNFSTQISTVSQPTTDQPTINQPTTDQPTINQPTTDQPTTSQPTIDQPTTNIEIPTDIKEQENKFIRSICERASQQIGKPYSRGGISPTTGFDCSGLRYRAFKEEGIKFSQRLSAHKFSDADVDIKESEAKPGDFMFWDQQPGKKKHDSIYHIEMIVSKPYTKNGKTYVKTLGSSTDAKDDGGNYVGKGVQIREREMKNYRHYGRPTYYYQLAQHEMTGSQDNLVAGSNEPSQDLQNQVLLA